MITTCPHCNTEFNIPDSAYRPGRKARCAVCAHVFVLPDPANPAPQASPAPEVMQRASQEPDAAPQINVQDTIAQAQGVPEQSVQNQEALEQIAPEEDIPNPDDIAPMGDAFDDLLRSELEAANKEAADTDTGSDTMSDDRVADYMKSSLASLGGQDASDAEAVAEAGYVAADPSGSEAASGGAQAKAFSDSDLDAVLNAGGFRASEAAGLDDADTRSSEAEAKQAPGKGKKILLLLAVLVCLAGIALGGYHIFSSFTAEKPDEGGPAEAISMEESALEIVRYLDVTSNGIKYDYIRNEKLGTILVLEGKVTNKYGTPKDNIVVEARLLNSKGVVIKSQRQVCGVLLTPLQLTVLGQNELNKALNNRIEIMANNINVMPQTSVPYMVVFIYPPDEAVEFEVSAVDAEDPPVE